jgi:hypothetical protein
MQEGDILIQEGMKCVRNTTNKQTTTTANENDMFYT